MYAFDTDSTTLNDTLPPFYNFVIQEYSIGVCGNYPTFKSKGCCYSSLDTKASKSYGSGSHYFVDSSILNMLPPSAVGARYCQLQATQGSALGYSRIYILQNSQCADGFVCNDGNLAIFAHKNCTTLVDTFPVTMNATAVISKAFGIVASNYMSVASTTMPDISWTGLTPSALLVPNFQNSGDWIGTFMFSIALIAAVAVLRYFLMKYRIKKTPYMLWFLISQSMWLIWVVGKTGYYFIIFSTVEQFAVYSEVLGVFFNIATLTLVFNSAQFMLTIKMHTPQFQLGLLCLILLIHVTLSGSLYFEYLRFIGSAQEWIKYWNKLTLGWVLFMFAFDTIPSFLATIALLKQTGPSGARPTRFERLSALHKVNSTFSLLLVFQLLNTLAYAAVAIIKYYFTEVLLNDRNWLALDGFFAFYFCAHSVLCCILMEHISVVATLRNKVTKQYLSRGEITSLNIDSMDRTPMSMSSLNIRHVNSDSHLNTAVELISTPSHLEVDGISNSPGSTIVQLGS